MAVIKWLFVVVFGIAGIGAIGLGVIEGSAPRTTAPRSAPVISLREFPAAGAVAEVAAPTPTPVKTDDDEPTPLGTVEEKPKSEEPSPPVEEKPAPVIEKPAPVAEKPAAPKPPAPAASPVGEGVLNLRASDTADVYLDGKKLGGAPVLGVKAKVGAHKLRFDCYDAAGNTVPGTPQTVQVKLDTETDLEFPCPTE
ncbi:MAG: hypothetical protein ACO1OB_15310 [Archangium sp.]